MAKTPPQDMEALANTLAAYILNHADGNLSRENLATLLAEAIEAEYGSRETFFEQVLQYLSQEEIAELFAFLTKKMQFSGIDPEMLDAIRAALKRSGASNASQADVGKTVSPTSTMGNLPPSHRSSRRW